MDVNGNVYVIEPDQASFEEHSDDDLAWLHLADQRCELPRYVMLTLSHDSQRTYVELNEQTRSCHDCLTDITFFQGGVVIQLKPEATAPLQHVSRIAISFKQLPAQQIAEIQHLLATTFARAMQPIPSLFIALSGMLFCELSHRGQLARCE
jgi:hypothetical protein